MGARTVGTKNGTTDRVGERSGVGKEEEADRSRLGSHTSIFTALLVIFKITFTPLVGPTN
jgi:hypothetical protein